MTRARLVLLMATLVGPAAAQWGGVIRFAVQTEPKVTHPWLAAEASSHAVTYLTSAGLIRIHRVTQKVEPWLATSWKWSDDGRTVTFELRRGVRFSDGSPFSAEDVRASLVGVLDPALASPHALVLQVGGKPPEITVVNAHKIAIRFAAPPAGWERLFGDLAMLPASGAAAAAGLGPFVLASRKTGVSVTLARNPHYWRNGPGGRALPYADGVEISIQANREIELQRFGRGELDFINKLDPDSFKRLSASHPSAARNLGPSLDPEILWFNQTGRAAPAFKDAWFRSRNFRQAVSLAIRREDLVRVAWQSLATASSGVVSPANKAWVNASIPPARFDLAAARKLLEKDGFRLAGARLLDRSGNPVEFSLITNAGNATRQRMGALIQQDLKALGIEVRLAALDFPSLVERISRTFAYDACLLGQNNVDSDPNGLMNIWLSSAPNNPWRPQQLKPSTEWEASIDRLMRAQASTADASARRRYFAQVQEIAHAEKPVIYLLYKNALAAVGARLGHAQPSLLYPHVYWNIDELVVGPGVGPAKTQLSSLTVNRQ